MALALLHDMVMALALLLQLCKCFVELCFELGILLRPVDTDMLNETERQSQREKDATT